MMECEKMGQFIAELRKEKQITQKELANQLNITDKAVSKWERGLSCPDIAILSSVARILGVTVSELLNGERESGAKEEAAGSVDHALQYADGAVKDRVKTWHTIAAAVFTGLLLTGAAVCVICDLAGTGGFTWSLYPLSSILFAWLFLFPTVKYGRKGITGSLVSLSASIIPFLFILNILTGRAYPVMPVGIRASVLSLIYLWLVYAVFKKLHTKKLLAGAVSLLLAALLQLAVSASLAGITGEPFLGPWNIFSCVLLVLAAAVTYCAYTVKRRL